MVISEDDVDTAQETEKLPVRDIKDRKPVQELQGQVLKADRCRYTEEFPRGDSNAEIPRKSWELTCQPWKYLTMIPL